LVFWISLLFWLSGIAPPDITYRCRSRRWYEDELSRQGYHGFEVFSYLALAPLIKNEYPEHIMKTSLHKIVAATSLALPLSANALLVTPSIDVTGSYGYYNVGINGSL
jgi:hypothetical protein